MRRVDKAEAISLLARETERLPVHFHGCVMCAIAGGAESEPALLAGNASAVAVLDRYPSRRGHVLVVLRRHVESIQDIPWEEYAAVQRLAWEAARALSRALLPKRVFVAALGSAVRRPMSFPHHHVHVVPLFDGGEPDRPASVFSWANSVSLYEGDEADELSSVLARAWPAGAGSG